jgi:hypothetical protein
MDSLRVGVRRALVEAYTDRMYWWEASLMAQRLVGRRARTNSANLTHPGVVTFYHSPAPPPLSPLPSPCDLSEQLLGLVFTFGSGQPGVQAMVLTLLCVVCGTLHAVLKPMRNPVVSCMIAAERVC